MAKKTKPKKRVEVDPNPWGEWRIHLHLGKRMAVQSRPQGRYRTKRAAIKGAKVWSEATGWPVTEK